MATEIRAELAEVLEGLNLNAVELAAILSSSRQSVYRWLRGAPAEGIAEVIVCGVAQILRAADQETIAIWRDTIAKALRTHGRSFDTLLAFLLVPPPRGGRALTPTVRFHLLAERGGEAFRVLESGEIEPLPLLPVQTLSPRKQRGQRGQKDRIAWARDPGLRRVPAYVISPERRRHDEIDVPIIGQVAAGLPRPIRESTARGRKAKKRRARKRQ